MGIRLHLPSATSWRAEDRGTHSNLQGGAQPLEAGLQKEETEAVPEAGLEEGYGSQRREKDSLANPRGRSLGPREGLREIVQRGEKGAERGEAWDRQGPRGRFTR